MDGRSRWPLLAAPQPAEGDDSHTTGSTQTKLTPGHGEGLDAKHCLEDTLSVERVIRSSVCVREVYKPSHFCGNLIKSRICLDKA